MILLDTDICLSILKGKVSPEDMKVINAEEVAVTSITAEELFFGANRSTNPVDNRILVEKFLLTVRILHTDLAVIKYIADVQHTLRRKGKKPNHADIVTYCTARVFEARLVTGNGKRYCFT